MEFKTLGELVQAAYKHSKFGIEDERLQVKSAGLNATTSADGGYLVNKTIIGPILESAQQKSKLWAKATKFNTKSYGAKIPYLLETTRKDSSVGKMAYWIGEGNAKSTDYPRFGQLDLKLNKLAVLCPATEEILQDSQLLNDWIDAFVTQKISLEVDRAILYGNPTTSMGGIMGGGNGNGVIGVASADPITETIIDNFSNSFAPSNEGNGEWYMSKENFNDIKASASDLINKGKLIFDGAWYLNGYKVNVMEQMYSGCDIVLGDFSQYAVLSAGEAIRDVSISFKYDLDDVYIRWVIRLQGDSFGQSYELQDGSTVGTFIVSEECIVATASSSSSSSTNSSSSSSIDSHSSASTDSSDSSNSSSTSSSSTTSQSTSSSSKTSESSSSGDNLTVTGTLTPDATGDYIPEGTKNGKTYYSNGTYYVWYSGASYIISTIMAAGISNYWYKVGSTITGDYTAAGTYTGTATVA
jgi:HK97 family phage major capsid protein